MPPHISRRKFLRHSSCAAIASTTLLSTLTNLKFMNAASMANSTVIGGNDYKAMVCVLLRGGNDSFNMLIPKEVNKYNVYANTRTNLAIPQADILALNGSDYGLHPMMTGIQELYNNSQLSFLSNIGTLIEPVTRPQLFTDESLVPLGLFSHSDQVQQWQTSVPNDRTAIGWGGRIADMFNSLNANPSISMNVSLNGNNIFQTGESATEYVLDREDGAVGIIGFDDPNANAYLDLRNRALTNIIDAQYDDIFQKTFIDVIKNSTEANSIVSEGLAQAPFLDDLFSDTDFSASLQMIARMISSREHLGARRQIFFVELGGWDNHTELLNSHAALLQELSNGMKEFNDALTRIDANDCVTTFTCSEFGRTLTTNGEGTDHAWGGNVMAMGGPVRGGQIFGEYPTLELGSELDLSLRPDNSTGILIPTLSVDEYFAELALWFGVSASDLSTIFPNIGNFYNTSSGTMPIGFIG